MKVFEGTVISDKMQDTVIVEVIRRIPHPLYKKLLKRSKKYKVDTKVKKAAVGQRVKIIETKPLSAHKHFKIQEVLS